MKQQGTKALIAYSKKVGPNSCLGVDPENPRAYTGLPVSTSVECTLLYNKTKTAFI